MFNRTKNRKKRHSGRLKSHEHTSYIALMALLLIAGLALTSFTVTAESPGPEPSSIALTGTMPAAAPTVGAVITSPVDRYRTSVSPVKVSGTCPINLLVEIFKNDIFAGSTSCTEAGIFSLDIDLLNGDNAVIARVYDALNQPGPDSNVVNIYYDALPMQFGPLTPMSFDGSQLLINTDAVFRGAFPGQEFSIPINIIGGKPPYAINVQWGDSTNKVISRNDNSSFTVPHTYQKAGNYQISIQATDANGRVAYLTVASIVNGQPGVSVTADLSKIETNYLLVLWPLYVGIFAVVIAFWVGKRREKYILSKHGQLLPS